MGHLCKRHAGNHRSSALQIEELLASVVELNADAWLRLAPWLLLHRLPARGGVLGKRIAPVRSCYEVKLFQSDCECFFGHAKLSR